MELKYKRYFLLTVAILFISLILNIVTSMDNMKYKYKVGTESYNNIENIRGRNESNIVLLNSAIEVGTISDMDAVKLYDNYKTISDSFINLWSEYSFYEEDKKGFSFKKIDTNKALLNDVNDKLQEYLKEIIYSEIKNKANKIDIKAVALDQFKEMKNLAMEIDAYYKEFYNTKLNGAIDEDKKDKIIKKYYWIDMLEGMNGINEGYINMDYKI
ncbi:MAG TPA: hypothetical protein VIK26_10135 [Clostridium sp.]